MSRKDDMDAGRGILFGIIASAILLTILFWAVYGAWSYFHPCCKCDETACYTTKLPLYKEKI